MFESTASCVSGLLPLRERASNDPDELLNRPSFDGCLKNFPDWSVCCGCGVGFVVDEFDDVTSVLSESSPLKERVNYKI